MANSKQTIKRAKQNIATYKLKHAQRSMARTAVKAVRASIDANDPVKAKEVVDDMCKKLLANLVIENYKIIESQ